MPMRSLQVCTVVRLFLALWLAITPTFVWAGSMTLLGVGGPAAGGGCSQSTTFLARTSGLNGTQTTAYTNLICGLVTDGIITGSMSGSGTGASACGSVLDALYIFASNTTTTANLNLCSTSFGLTTTAAPTFTASQGYTGNGTTQFLDTGYAPSTAAGNLTLNSGSLGLYVLNNRTTASGGEDFCTFDGTNASDILPMFTGNTTLFDVNDGTFAGNAATTSQGFWVASRNGSSTTINAYRNNSAQTNVSATSTALPTKSLMALACNSAGGIAQNFSADQISAAFIAAGISSAQQTSLSNRINAYMTALGINVY